MCQKALTWRQSLLYSLQYIILKPPVANPIIHRTTHLEMVRDMINSIDPSSQRSLTESTSRNNVWLCCPP
jgi:hypothetical protein